VCAIMAIPKEGVYLSICRLCSGFRERARVRARRDDVSARHAPDVSLFDIVVVVEDWKE